MSRCKLAGSTTSLCRGENAWGRWPLHFTRYIVGDIYHVRALKNYAAQQFVEVGLYTDFDVKDLADAMEHFWSSATSKNDTIMKKAIGRIVFKNLDKVMKCKRIAERMPKEDELGYFVITEAACLGEEGLRSENKENIWRDVSLMGIDHHDGPVIDLR